MNEETNRQVFETAENFLEVSGWAAAVMARRR
jgi:hypothetical protein